MKIVHLLFALALSLSATAEAASYVRIWRGYQKAGLSDEAFLRGMNHALLPATGELALGQARLESYLPVVLPIEWEARGLPSEVALLSYESEAAYRAYRATAEGIHYGNMHWDLFDRATSASLVPVPYAGAVTFDQAYEIAAGDPTWSSGKASFNVIERVAETSDEAFLETVRLRIAAVAGARPKSYYVLVSRNYALEYASFDEAATPPSPAMIPLAAGKVLATGTGVVYPVGADTAQSEVRATWERHLAAWNARDLDAIVSDYHDGSVVIRNDEIYRGRAEIRALFAELFGRFDLVTEASIDRIIHEGNVTYLSWRAKGKDSQGVETPSGQGTDTFVVTNGRIDTQTITADPAFWQAKFVR